MMPFSKVAAAQVALREAARALTIGDGLHTVDGGLDGLTVRGLAADVAYTLDALAAVLREVTHEPVPTSAVSHNMQALFQHVREGASMARHISGTDEQEPRSSRVFGVQ